LKRIAILGSTGSIGRSALSVVDAHPDRLRIVGLAAGENAPALAEQTVKYQPEIVGVATETALTEMRQFVPAGVMPEAVCGPAGLLAIATHPSVDLVLCASSGTAGLEAALAAIEAGKSLALANKEVLVMAGQLMIDAARRRGIEILPVDSEHNAIHQCLHGRDRRELRRVILTASGGPFRELDAAALDRVTPDDALKHPTWQMGRKITIDSATLMNKGLEVIEAHWLFGLPADRIDVVVHPQSIVHSMVELRDGSVIAQLSTPDMRLPIQYALAYPERWDTDRPALDLARLGRLDFCQPDLDRFPCLRLAYDALARGGASPIVLNAANEVAVAAFLDGRLAFPGIARLIAEALDAVPPASHPRTLADVREVDGWARRVSADIVGTLRSA
jgi:1-deoxy-D-xylulose-5-phosphate reductoisomerase